MGLFDGDGSTLGCGAALAPSTGVVQAPSKRCKIPIARGLSPGLYTLHDLDR